MNHNWISLTVKLLCLSFSITVIADYFLPYDDLEQKVVNIKRYTEGSPGIRYNSGGRYIVELETQQFDFTVDPNASLMFEIEDSVLVTYTQVLDIPRRVTKKGIIYPTEYSIYSGFMAFPLVLLILSLFAVFLRKGKARSFCSASMVLFQLSNLYALFMDKF